MNDTNFLFCDGSLSDKLDNRLARAAKTIAELPADGLEPESEGELFDQLRRKFVVNPLKLIQSRISREGPREVGIELTGDNAFLYGEDRITVKGLELTIIVPFEGDAWLFRMRPSRWSTYPQGEVVGQELHLSYRVVEKDVDEIKKRYHRELQEIEDYIDRQASDIEGFNILIDGVMRDGVTKRRNELRANSQFTDALGIPERTPQRQSRSATRPNATPSPSSAQPKPKVFICYAKTDEAKADELYGQLKRAGADPWLDKRTLVLGDDWENEIKKAVTKADAFVVCLRPGFDEIGFRQREIRWAIDALKLRPPGRGFIIPYIIEPCELPDWCKPIHAGSDLSKQTTVAQLIAAIEKHCNWSHSV